MGKHLHEINIDGRLIKNSPAKLKSLKYLIKQERQLDDEILVEFPLGNYGELNSYICINGSEELIERFTRIDNHKLDIIEKLENIFIKDVTPNNQIVLNFNKDSLQAEGVYRFTYDYLEMAFQMGKFSTYCLENNFEKLFLDTVRKLCLLQPAKEYQYRLILEKDKWLIRGVTSVRYNNYDNHLALYLTLLALHKHAQKMNQWYTLNKAYLSDSEIVIMFDAISPTKIIGVGDLYIGLVLTNNEIKEKSFSVEYRFRLEDEEGNEFGAIPEGEEPIFTIRHDSSIKNVKERIKQLNHLELFKERIVNLILDISQSPFLSEDRIYNIFRKIKLSKSKFSPETKEVIKELQEQKFINNTLHIIKAFSRMNELVTDVEEKIHLERIFFEVCLDLQKVHSKKK